MVGGVRRDEPLVMSNANVFAALGTLRKKKKATDKDQASSSKSKGKKSEKEVEKKEVYWAPAPLTVKSWADVDDDDDDDYYATAAPPQSAWAAPKEPEPEPEPAAEESESEDEGLDEGDDEVEEEHENEHEFPVEIQPVTKSEEAPPAQKENDRQLSKKELKKKELEELDAVLAELGLAKKEASVTDGIDGAVEEKASESNGDLEKRENIPAESKTAKKKKKKEKSVKDVKESSQGQAEGNDVGNGSDDAGGIEKPEDASAVDVKERLKKVALAKKKKSSKEMDAAARAAASEAAIRSAKLAAAKKKEKKEKSQYNQQPVR